MKVRNLRVKFIAVTVLLCNAPSQLAFAQHISDSASLLRSFLIEYLGAPESEEDRTNTRYLSTTVDLNGDGKPETIVYILGSNWCGGGGCPYRWPPPAHPGASLAAPAAYTAPAPNSPTDIQ
jgi:hypothetical protein